MKFQQLSYFSNRCVVTCEVFPTITSMLTSASTSPETPLDPLKTWSRCSSQATGICSPFTSWGQSEGFLTSGMSLENTINVHVFDMYKHTESKHPFVRRAWGVRRHCLNTDLTHCLGKPPTFLCFIMKYVHTLNFLLSSIYSEQCCRSTEVSSWCCEDPLHKQSSTLGWMLESWQETEIEVKLPGGHNTNQCFLFHAAGRTKGACSTGSLVVKIALQG